MFWMPVVLLAMVVGHSFQAVAATIDLVKGTDGQATIMVLGEISSGDDERFATVAGDAPEQTTVLLDSLGGNLSAGLRIGSAVRMRAWKTAVPNGAFCASACGLIWLGGVQRAVGEKANVGFHAAFIEGSNGLRRETGVGNALVGSYLGRLGLTDNAVIYLTSSPPDGAAWLDEATARQLGVRATFNSQVQALPNGPAVPPISTGLTSTKSVPDQLLVPKLAERAALFRMLYADFPRSVRTSDGTTCVGRACKVRVAADDSWQGSDGVEHRILVGVAEVKDDCHACEAILGVGEFKRASPSEAWQRETLSPAVTRVGGYGLYAGKLSFMDGGSLGRVVIVDDADGGQGVFTNVRMFLIRVGPAFKEVLTVPLSITVNGSCDDNEAECRQKILRSNYDSQLTVTAQDDGKLHIEQTIKAAILVPSAAWVIDRSGVARQTAGGKVIPGGDAQDRATMESVAFTQGRTDRLSYENWFSTLPPDMHAGAEFWNGRRSLRAPGNCDAPPGQTPEWTLGCNAARAKLTILDRRRKLEPDYKRGWNSL